MKPSEERTSGNSKRRLEMHREVNRRVARRWEGKDGAKEARLISGDQERTGKIHARSRR